MKIRGRVKNLAPIKLIFIMAIAALFTIPLRTFQLVNIIEPQTGFYAKYDISIPFLYILLATACLLLFLFSFISEAMPKPKLPEGKNKLIGITSFLLSASLLFDSIVQIDKLLFAYNKCKSESNNVFFCLVKMGGVTAFVQALFAILSAVYFSIFAISHLKGKRFYESEQVMALFPIIWGLCRAIQRFIEPIRFKNVSELLLQLFMLIFMLVFFLSFARIASQVNCDKSVWLLFSSGLCACLIAITITVPSVIVMIMGNSSLLYSHYPVSFCDMFFAIFVIALLSEFTPAKIEIEKNSEETEGFEHTEEESERVQESEAFGSDSK